MNIAFKHTGYLFLLIPMISCHDVTSSGINNKSNDTTIHGKKDTVSVRTKEIDTFYNIYITFDDGPLAGSEAIDKATKSEEIKFNVFVVGRHVFMSKKLRSYFNLYKRNPFIEIGNHSYSHAYNRYKAFYNNPPRAFTDFLKNEQALQLDNKIVRLPARNIWRLSDTAINDVKSGSAVADSLFKHGYKVFGWDIEWQHDNKTAEPIQTTDDLKEMIEQRLKSHKTVRENNLVLLAHDEMFRKNWEASELKNLIDKLKANGKYRFMHLSEYPD